MLTNAAILVYQEYHGAPGRQPRPDAVAQRAQVPEREWGMLLDFLQDLHLVQQGLASADYAARLEQRLHANCSGPEVISALMGLAQANGRA
jgi:hypothetical protein